MSTTDKTARHRTLLTLTVAGAFLVSFAPLALEHEPQPVLMAQLSGNSLLNELRDWRWARESNDASGYQAYLDKYPEGKFARLAAAKLAAIKRAKTPEPQPTLSTEDAARVEEAAAEPTVVEATPDPAEAQPDDVREELLPATTPSVAEPDPDPESELKRHQEELLAAAEMDIKALRLTSPRGNNAMEKINRVLAAAPRSPRALSLRSRVVARYIELARKQRQRGNLDKARRFLQRALKADRDSVSLREALEEQERAEQKAAEKHSQPDRKSPPISAAAVKPNLVAVQGGCYMMGSPADEPRRDPDERQHQVCVADFKIAITDVTRARFARFVDATGYITDAENDAGGKPGCSVYGGGWENVPETSWRNPRFSQTGEHPVVCVSWNDAMAYVEWLSAKTGEPYRLPTEAEWEFAARAGTTTPFPTGNCIHTDQANYNGSFDYAECGANTGVYRGGTVEAKFAHPNPLGLYNMPGNVWNWTCSAYDKGYGGSEISCADRSDTGPRVVRGGSWFFEPAGLRSASRSWDHLDYRDSHQGFRLAQDI